MIHLTLQARSELKGDEALVFDWHRVALCCAVARVVRRFRSDLPPDFGLRSVLGRAETS